MCYCSVLICRILKRNEQRETQTYCWSQDKSHDQWTHILLLQFILDEMSARK